MVNKYTLVSFSSILLIACLAEGAVYQTDSIGDCSIRNDNPTYNYGQYIFFSAGSDGELVKDRRGLVKWELP